ncbi:hypothetical protein J3R30DRAFT_3295061 [Lentinula aciculospora]|uniref:Cryptic loci regulator 2 N-terminal domain-containing protein n=1 Tax=Lentinula aciculospora TaxID=153920 RepID=A0A9W9A5P9_9AGAR|nr:hypothetical protein J3R30DRAFT_3295061 [Lentinula aciculospora]
MGRSANAKHELPSNPVYREIEHSDGVQSAWPKNTTRIVDSEGQVNWMQYVPSDEGMAIKWRVQVGQALANALNWPKGPNYVLQDWPADYRMFIHNKGPASNPRQDVYLFGSKATPKFRSVPEFIPHAIWLCSDLSEKCQCKYCSKGKQRDITSNMGERGIIEKTSPTPSSSPVRPSLPKRRPRPEGSALRNQVVYAAVQKSRLRKPSIFIVPKHPAPVEKVTDLEAAHHDNSALQLRRWFRNDELVWVELETPIAGPKGNGDIIKAWPAIVEDSWTRAYSSKRSEDSSISSSNGSYPDYDPDNPPWTVTHYTKYKLKLLATSCSLMARDDQVLPYQAYLPATELIYALQDVLPARIRFDTEYMTNFSPITARNPDEHSPLPPSFEDSTGPYALAIQIGSQIAGFWGLTDDWDFKFSFRSDPPPSSNPTISRSEGYSLQDVIVAASNSNANNTGPQTSYGTSAISGNRYMMVEELHRAKATTLGAPKAVGHTFTQKNFHGLWWGAERIWTGDLLRLKIGRNAIARDGAPHIVAPSLAGPNALLHSAQNGGSVDPKDLGARSRGVFMRLDALFTVEVDIGKGRKRNECRAAGTLYELADIDWVDPSEVATKRSKSTPVGTDGAASGEYSNGMSSALPQPSPLKPTVLPNPDPAVPVEKTAPHMLSEMLPHSAPKGKQNGEFKPPIPISHYELPQPPIGYKFRPILDPGYEAVFSLTLLSGRYYPGILTHPLLLDTIEQAFTPEGKSDPQSAHLWALEGLEPGYANSVDPIRFKKDRLKMVMDGEANARAQLIEHLSANLEQVNGDVSMENGEEEEVMEVDPVANDQMQVDL